jgi:hypothetical protein
MDSIAANIFQVSWHGLACFGGQHDKVEQTSCTPLTPGKTVKSHFALDTTICKGIAEALRVSGGMHTQQS